MNPTNAILALDTASPSPGVTLLSPRGVAAAALPADGRASERLLGVIQACFAELGLPLSSCGRIAVCSGPGSFTGVRVGLATAWGLGRALGIPVEAVPTLAAIAEAARGASALRVAAALDAGRGDLVWQIFDLSRARARPLGPAEREPAAKVLASAAEDLPLVALPADLLPGRSVGPGTPVSSALAEAVSREPAPESARSFAAIYSRPSAAEEKRGAS